MIKIVYSSGPVHAEHIESSVFDLESHNYRVTKIEPIKRKKFNIFGEDITHIHYEERNCLHRQNDVFLCVPYSDVNWNELICNASNHIDLMAHYYDSWLDQNHDALVDFFARESSKMFLFISDPNNIELMRQVNQLFQNLELTELQNKIFKTREKLQSIVKEAGANRYRLHGKLEMGYRDYRNVIVNWKQINNDIVIDGIIINNLFEEPRINPDTLSDHQLKSLKSQIKDKYKSQLQ